MKGLVDVDVFVYRVAFASKDEDEKLACRRFIDTITQSVFFDAECDSFDGFITGKGNYRYDIAKTLPYKGNRKQEKPKHYEALRKQAVKMGCVEVEGCEADDAIGIAAYSSDPSSYTIITIDKDLDMIRGKHYNFVKKVFNDVSEEQALKFFYQQLLSGDRTDNIQGIPGIGPAKAKKLLKDAETETQLYAAAREAYANDTLLLENARLLWIQREPNQLWTPPNENT